MGDLGEEKERELRAAVLGGRASTHIWRAAAITLSVPSS